MSSSERRLFSPSDRILRQFSALWIIFFGGLASWYELAHLRHTLAISFAILAVTFGPLGLIRPRAMRPVFVGWMTLVLPIGWVVSRVIMALIFYGLFTPTAVLFRLRGRDELRLRPQPQGSTRWQQRESTKSNTQYLRQF